MDSFGAGMGVKVAQAPHPPGSFGATSHLVPRVFLLSVRQTARLDARTVEQT